MKNQDNAVGLMLTFWSGQCRSKDKLLVSRGTANLSFRDVYSVSIVSISVSKRKTTDLYMIRCL